MPITIIPTPPHSFVGPGTVTNWSTDFIGPIQSGSSWVIGIYMDNEGAQPVLEYQIPTTSHTGQIVWYSAPGVAETAAARFAPQEAENVFVLAKLVAPDTVTVIDSGTKAATWSSTTGLGVQIERKTTTGGSGLTDEQALQLSQTHASTFPTLLIDNLTLLELTNGPSQGPIASQLPTFVFGVIVRIADVPPDLLPTTPDGDYWFPSLAVVRVFRGSDLWLRIPVHTSSKMIPFIEENVVAALAVVTGTTWLLNMSVQIDFRDGVTGQVFLMHFP